MHNLRGVSMKHLYIRGGWYNICFCLMCDNEVQSEKSLNIWNKPPDFGRGKPSVEMQEAIFCGSETLNASYTVTTGIIILENWLILRFPNNGVDFGAREISRFFA